MEDPFHHRMHKIGSCRLNFTLGRGASHPMWVPVLHAWKLRYQIGGLFSCRLTGFVQEWRCCKKQADVRNLSAEAVLLAIVMQTNYFLSSVPSTTLTELCTIIGYDTVHHTALAVEVPCQPSSHRKLALSLGADY